MRRAAQETRHDNNADSKYNHYSDHANISFARLRLARRLLLALAPLT
jgi:hypothetical protein